MRFHLVVLILLASALAGQGCATRDPAAQAAEQAQTDDAACAKKGAPGTPAYDDCRKSLAEAQAQQSAVHEQKRRDFDRVLGAGTDAQGGL